MQLNNRSRWVVLVPFACLLLLAYWGTPASTTFAQSQALNSQAEAGTTYIVQRGDTLYSIANRFNVTARQVADANNIVNVNLIRVGQLLVIPGQTAPAPTSPSGGENGAPSNGGNGTIPYPTAAATSTWGNGTVPQPTATAYPTVVPTVTPTATPIAMPIFTPEPYVPPVIESPIIESPWTAPNQLVEIFSPVAKTAYRSPIEVVGFSRTFESAVSMRLVDEDGYILAERSATGGGVDGYDFFQTYLRFVVTEPVTATLEFYQTAGEGDELAVEAAIPVTLLPGQRAIDLVEPRVNTIICDDIAVSGYSFTFEGSVPVTLAWRDGTQIAVEPATGGGVEYRDWRIVLDDFSVSEPRPVLLSVYEESARDGSQIDTTRIPLSIYPAGHAACSR